MSAATTREMPPSSASDGHEVEDSSRPGSGAADERGVTVIRPRVVERVAAQAVREVADTAGTGRRVLGHAFGTPGTQDQAAVRADVDGQVTTLDVAMTVVYPAPVLAVTRRTRHHIIDRIVELTGLSVRRLDITVVGMSVTGPSTSRVR